MNGLKTLTIDGVPLRDFGVWTNGQNAWNAAERDVTTISVPGRNGDLILDNGRFKNISVSYECLMRRDFRHRFDELRAFLSYKTGYRRIEDEREEEYYRMGRILSGISVSEVIWNADAAVFTLNISFKPQRFLKRGDIAQTISGGASLYNPTYFEALPLIRIYGSGALQIGKENITVTSNSYPYVDIDCEAQNAYCGSTNCNGLVSVSGAVFPGLQPGENKLTLPNSMPKVEIMPRWWTI